MSAPQTKSYESSWHERLEKVCLYGLRVLDDDGWHRELVTYLEDLPYIEPAFAKLKTADLLERMPVPMVAMH